MRTGPRSLKERINVAYRKLRTLMFPAASFTVLSDQPPEVILERLRENTKGSAWMPFFSRRAFVGKVDGDRFRVQRNPFGRGNFPYNNSFAPEFSGSVEACRRGSRVEVQAGLMGFVRGFMVFWFGFAVVWTAIVAVIVPVCLVILIVALLLGEVPPVGVFLAAASPLFGAAIIGFGIGLVQFGWRLDYEKSRAKLLDLMKP